MIIGNEEKIIERCINSALPVIDAISICANGSDNSVNIIKKFNNKIPTNIAIHKWKNFEYNRSLSFTEAVRFCTELGWNPNESYCLFLDADMKLVIFPSFNKDSLKSIGYRVIQFNNTLRYDNLRLARMDVNWRCVSVTHEYWDPQTNGDTPRLKELEIDDIGDGGSKADKFVRDERLLAQGLIDEPKNVRYLFYMAQTKRCLGKYDESIEYYKKRIQAGGFEEEVWYSHFMIAQNYEAIKNYELAIYWYLEAYNRRPSRAESLYQLAKLYRLQGKNKLGYMFALKALEIPYPEHDVLFIDSNVYKYLNYLEISICGYYTGNKKEGFIATENLIRNKEVDPGILTNAISNLQFYVEAFPYKKKITLESQLKHIKYNVMNPCIISWKNGYLVNARHVNYYMDKDNNYITVDGGSLIIPRNFLYHFNGDFELLSCNEIKDDLEVYDKRKSIIGLEDIRLFKWDDKIYALPNTKLYSNAPQIALVEINTDTYEYDSKHHIDFDHNPNICQKNWLPLSNTDSASKVKVIQNHDPLTVIEIDKEGKFETIIKKVSENNLSRFRGSAGPLPYRDGYLSIIHEVYFINSKRHYYHRFVWYNKDFQIIRFTFPFYFLTNGVEYVCGMAFNKDETSLVISLGVRDAEAHLCILDMKDVDNYPAIIPTSKK